MYDCSAEDIKYTPNPNYVHVKSEFQSFKYQYVLEQPETIVTTDRRITPLKNETDPKLTVQCSLGQRIPYNLEIFSDPGRLIDYTTLNSGDLSKDDQGQLLLKKEILQNDFHTWNQKEKSVENGRRRPKETKQNYSCHLCDSSYKEKFHLDAHLDIFHEAEKHPVKDTGSNPIFTFGENRSRAVDKAGNIQEESIENILFVCYSCNAKFSKESSLNLHMYLVHKAPNNEAVIACMFCQKSFSEHAMLDKHILSHHPSWRPFSCHVCGESFALLKTLNQHLATCHKEFCTDNKIQTGKASENIVRLNYTACPIPPAANNTDSGRTVLSKRKKSVTNSKEPRKKKSIDKRNRVSENKQECGKYRHNKISLVQVGSDAKISQHEKGDDQLHNDIQENISHTKRRRIEIDTDERNRDFEQIFQYECMQCQLKIPSLNCLFRHVDECHKNVTQMDSSSKGNQLEPFGCRRNIQLDCRMGGGSVTSFGNIAERNGGNTSEIALKKQALLEKILFNKETTNLAKQLMISCRFCEFTATDFLEFNDHLLLHGI